MNHGYDSYASVNGDLVPTGAARISPLGEGVMFGRGLFETVKVIEGRPAFFAAHHARLATSCTALGLPWSVSLPELRARCSATLVANARVNGSLKIMVLADPAGCVEIVVTRAPLYSNDNYSRGFRLNVQLDPVRRIFPAHKSTNYLANLLARQAARERGADDALFVDEVGEVIEGAATNIFAVVSGRVLTPPLERGILPGVVRGEILKQWKDRGVEERQVTRQMLETAEEVFATNALVGVMPVSGIDANSYQISGYRTTPTLMSEFAQWQRESL